MKFYSLIIPFIVALASCAQNVELERSIKVAESINLPINRPEFVNAMKLSKGDIIEENVKGPNQSGVIRVYNSWKLEGGGKIVASSSHIVVPDSALSGLINHPNAKKSSKYFDLNSSKYDNVTIYDSSNRAVWPELSLPPR